MTEVKQSVMTKRCRIRKFIPFIAIAIVGFLGFEIFKVVMKSADISNLFNYGIGLAGLWVGWQSTRVSLDGAEDAKEQAIFDKINEIDKACEERDRLFQEEVRRRDEFHDQEIAKIREQLVAIAIQVELNSKSCDILTNRFFDVQGELAKHMAHLAVATRLGEIALRIDKMQNLIGDR